MSYKKVKQPDHPHAMADGYVYEHRLVMEGLIGRYLEPHEQVHHKDKDKSNNDPKNLELCPDQKSHSQEHAYREDELIEWLIQYAHEFGRFPTKKECDKHEGMPHSSTYIRRFGSWSIAKGIAQRWNDELNYDWREEIAAGVEEMINVELFFNKGDWVKWISQSQGSVKEKQGCIIAFVPKGVNIREFLPKDVSGARIKGSEVSTIDRALVEVPRSSGHGSDYYTPRYGVLEKMR